MGDPSDPTTFADLGIPFPLYEAPVRSCAAQVGPAICHFCRTERHYFCQLNDVSWMGPCPECGTHNKQTGDDRSWDGSQFAWNCIACGAGLTSRTLKWTEERYLACLGCIGAREIGFARDTEFGIVDGDSLASGITGGVPGLTAAEGFELVVVDENWNGTDIVEYRVASAGVRIDPEHLRELYRTPVYHCWQQERWLFCCRRPMIYMGVWPDVVRVLDPGDRGELFRTIYATAAEGGEHPYGDWSAAARDFERHDPEMYVFRCPECERLRCHIDCS